MDDKESGYASGCWELQIWKVRHLPFGMWTKCRYYFVNTGLFQSCEDCTLATLWKRAESFSSSHEAAPFSKLALSKLLVLKDKKAREDYFAQQAAFVMMEGRKDVNAVSLFDA